MIWISTIIPIIGILIMLKWYRKHLAWWEAVIPLIASILFTLIFKFTVEKVQVSDEEFHGALVTEARYYEYWETYVRRTCTRSVSCGKNCTRTVYYDCSYCDENPAKWKVVNSLGEEFSISEEYYNQLKKRWKAREEFVDLGRSISHGGFGCGKDGDMFRIKWDGKPLTSDFTSTKHWYENRIQAAHSVFDFPEILEEDIKTYGIVNYPDLIGYKQSRLLGESPSWLSKTERVKGDKLIQHLCGYWGPKKKVNVWVILFVDKPSLAANYQESYWDGGNDNEVTICLGLNSKTRKIDWVKGFSWTSNRKFLVDLREDISKLETLNFHKLTDVISDNIPQYEWRDFKEFNYLTVEPPLWAIILTYVFTALITFGLCYWAIVNDYIADDNNPLMTIKSWKR